MTHWCPIDLMREVICITESSVLVVGSSSQPVLGSLGRPSIRYVCMSVCIFAFVSWWVVFGVWSYMYWSDFCWNDSIWLRFLALAVRLDGLSREKMCSTARWIDSTWWYPQTDLPANEKTCCTVLLRCISVSSLVDCHTWQWLWLWLPWRLVSNVMPFKVILGLPQRRAK